MGLFSDKSIVPPGKAVIYSPFTATYIVHSAGEGNSKTAGRPGKDNGQS